uniref:Uncharacterized protein n=1 Tax=Knipowitschia caucasica TaxID=637954 RepID=A0AAV2LXX0_KNICA
MPDCRKESMHVVAQNPLPNQQPIKTKQRQNRDFRVSVTNKLLWTNNHQCTISVRLLNRLDLTTNLNMDEELSTDLIHANKMPGPEARRPSDARRSLSATAGAPRRLWSRFVHLIRDRVPVFSREPYTKMHTAVQNQEEDDNIERGRQEATVPLYEMCSDDKIRPEAFIIAPPALENETDSDSEKYEDALVDV